MRELTEIPKTIADSLKEIIPDQVMRKYRIAVFGRAADGALQVAMTSPQDVEALNVLRFLSERQGVAIEIYSTSDEIFDKLATLFSQSQGMVGDVVLSLDSDSSSNTNREATSDGSHAAPMDQVLQDTSVARLVQVVVEHALEARASDIHIEPIDKNYRVRFRVDGSLQAALVLPVDIGRSVVARIKILANLKIDEKRKPQDGRFRVDYKTGAVDLRVSTFPVVEGEKVVLRVLDTSKGLADLKGVGLEGRNLEVLTRKIREPYGIILITGPTGSG